MKGGVEEKMRQNRIGKDTKQKRERSEAEEEARRSRGGNRQCRRGKETKQKRNGIEAEEVEKQSRRGSEAE
jgi:hypothetical protein